METIWFSLLEFWAAGGRAEKSQLGLLSTLKIASFWELDLRGGLPHPVGVILVCGWCAHTEQFLAVLIYLSGFVTFSRGTRCLQGNLLSATTQPRVGDSLVDNWFQSSAKGSPGPTGAAVAHGRRELALSGSFPSCQL